ncbi:unnamed protein product, partial [Closterium sp. NIES-54]
ATATERVRDDVRDMLQMRRCELFVSSVNRPNLFYEVREKPPGAASAVESIAGFILEHYAPSDSGIVYCFSRKECEQVQCGGSSIGVIAAWDPSGTLPCRHGPIPSHSHSLSLPLASPVCCATLVLTSPVPSFPGCIRAITAWHPSGTLPCQHGPIPSHSSHACRGTPCPYFLPPFHHSQVAWELSLHRLSAPHQHADMDPSHRCTTPIPTHLPPPPTITLR